MGRRFKHKGVTVALFHGFPGHAPQLLLSGQSRMILGLFDLESESALESKK
jgi:hypothetical protein